MTRTNINIDLPIDVEQGDAGLFYVTSPNIRGLLVTGQTENEALDKVQWTLTHLAEANRLVGASRDMLEALLVVAAQFDAIDNICNQEACAAVRAAIAKATGATDP